MSEQTSTAYDDRLRAAADGLRDRALAAYSTFLSSPDDTTGEQWDAGQLLAHAAEFGPYWLAQAQLVIDATESPAPFGRTKSDPERIAAIERDRESEPLVLLDHVDAWVGDIVGWLAARDTEELARMGVHQVLGEMTVQRIVEHFCVEHLEEHAEQLAEQLAGR